MYFIRQRGNIFYLENTQTYSSRQLLENECIGVSPDQTTITSCIDSMEYKLCQGVARNSFVQIPNSENVVFCAGLGVLPLTIYSNGDSRGGGGFVNTSISNNRK